MLFLFDIDGTLLASQGTGSRAMKLAGQQIFGHDFSFGDIDSSGKIDPQIFGELIAVNDHTDISWNDHDIFQKVYLEILVSELKKKPIVALPGVVSLLETLRAMNGVSLGLLTGNYRAAAPHKLESAGLNPLWFPVGAFGDEASTRPGLIEVARQRYLELHDSEIEVGEIIVVGDTPRDVECAHINGCMAIAVATGRWGRKSLEMAGAEVVLDDLRDPSPILAFTK